MHITRRNTSVRNRGCLYGVNCTSECSAVRLHDGDCLYFQAWEKTEEGSWLREYPVTLIQFLVFLYRNVTPFSQVCTGQEFIENLVAVLFPKRRRLAKSQEVCLFSTGSPHFLPWPRSASKCHCNYVILLPLAQPVMVAWLA